MRTWPADARAFSRARPSPLWSEKRPGNEVDLWLNSGLPATWNLSIEWNSPNWTFNFLLPLLGGGDPHSWFLILFLPFSSGLPSPFPIPCALFIICRSPLSLPFPSSTFFILRSSFFVPRFPSFILRSPLPVAPSLFPVSRSTFLDVRSSMSVPRCPFLDFRSSTSVPVFPFKFRYGVLHTG